MEQKPYNARFAGPIPHDASYYSKCVIGGILACGLTHAAITPLDVTKCNMQVNPQKFKGLVSGLRTILAEEGALAIWKGWLPTLLGYSAQGAFKYGLYEVFKDQYSTLVGKETAEKYKGLIWCSASASAEFFADIALCPMEMTKVKIQTSTPGSFPTAFGPALAAMRANAAETKFPFGSLRPLWSRQIPYTVAKFYFFEKVVPFVSFLHSGRSTLLHQSLYPTQGILLQSHPTRNHFCLGLHCRCHLRHCLSSC